MNDLYSAILEEIGAATAGIDEMQVDRVCTALATARRIVVYGCGREAVQIRGFAMRLYHLGLDAAVAGDVTAPPVGEGDVFLASSGPGELATVLALMAKARKAGARTIVLTAVPDGSAAGEADDMLVIPAQTMASDQGASAKSILPMGSVYEGALFVLFEVMVHKLQDRLGVTPEAMRARHTNLE